MMNYLNATARHAACLSALAAAILSPAYAQSPAASACPDYSFPGGSPPPNLAANPSFETAAAGVPVGTVTCWPRSSDQSAAAKWLMHSNNPPNSAPVCSALVPADPHIGPTGHYMLAVKAGANEGGVYQGLTLDPSKAYMFSVWVKVLKGKVAIQSRGMVGGPVSWTTKTGEWEQLRVCTNSRTNTDMMVVFNQDPNGGVFYVDRAELVEVMTRE